MQHEGVVVSPALFEALFALFALFEASCLKHVYEWQGNRMRARRAPCVLMWRVFGRHLVLVLDKGSKAW